MDASWTIKKAECWRVDAFELRHWRTLLRVPWTARTSNLKKISPEYSLEGLMLNLNSNTLATWWKELTLKKTLMQGKIEGMRRGWQRMRWLGGITDSMDMSLSKFQEWWRTGKPGLMQSMGLQIQKRLSDWTTLLLLQALCLCGSTHPISLEHFKPKWKKKNSFLIRNTEKHKEKK